MFVNKATIIHIYGAIFIHRIKTMRKLKSLNGNKISRVAVRPWQITCIVTKLQRHDQTFVRNCTVAMVAVVRQVYLCFMFLYIIIIESIIVVGESHFG